MRTITNQKKNIIARKTLTSAKGFAAFLIGVFLLSGCEQLGDLDDIIGDNDGDKDKMQMYKVQLNPLNSSGVTGTATVMMTENGYFEVIADVEGLVPNMEHPQHIHGFVMENMADKKSTCPDPSVAGEDGLISHEEIEHHLGEEIILLDDRLVPLAADNYPVAKAAGNISYGAKVKTHSLVSAFDAAHNGKQTMSDLELGKRVMVIHGAYMKDNMVVAPGTEGAEYMAHVAVACGEIMEMK